MASPKARVKKGNIALFVVLIGIGAYVLNKSKIDQKLIEVGLLEKETAAEKKVIEAETVEEEKTADFEEESKKIEIAEKTEEIKETKDNKANKAHISTQADVFFLAEKNPIEVSVEGVAGKDVSVLMGRYKNIQVETLDKNAGKYNIRALRKGKAELSVMTKIDGKIDFIKTQEFEIVSRAEYAKRNASQNSNSSTKREYRLPMPLPAIDGKSGGSISAAVLRQTSRLDLLFDQQNNGNTAIPTLLSYEMIRYSPTSSSTNKAKISGANFNTDSRRLVSQAKVNDLFYFTNIKAKMPNGKIVELPSIGFDIQ